MPKIYIASSFALIPKVIEVSNMLESHGNKITCKWWSKDNINIHAEKDDNLHPENFYGHPACPKILERDYVGIKECQILVLVAGDIPSKFNGANIEYGMAYALGKTCFSIGKLENCAMYYPLIKCNDLKELDKRIYDWCIYPMVDDNEPDDFDPELDCMEEEIMDGW